jgi:hypothetical protein
MLINFGFLIKKTPAGETGVEYLPAGQILAHLHSCYAV